MEDQLEGDSQETGEIVTTEMAVVVEDFCFLLTQDNPTQELVEEMAAVPMVELVELIVQVALAV